MICCKKFLNLTLGPGDILIVTFSWCLLPMYFISPDTCIQQQQIVWEPLSYIALGKEKQSFDTDLFCAGQVIMKIHQCVMERRMMLLKKCFLSVTDCPGRSNSTCNNPPVNGARPYRAVGTGGERGQ